MMPVPASGSTTVNSTRAGRAPSVRAAFTRFGSTASSPILVARTTSGRDPTAAAITAPEKWKMIGEPNIHSQASPIALSLPSTASR